MFLVAIDQGTTSTRAIVFDAELRAVASAQEELRQLYPAPGWVEHDPEEIWAATVATVRAAMRRADASAHDVAAIGITNQRETTIVWDRESGKPIHNAIVWRTCVLRRTRPPSSGRLGCCSIPISQRRRSDGCSIASRAHAVSARKDASPSARSIRF
jgi:glycerol kinase